MKKTNISNYCCSSRYQGASHSLEKFVKPIQELRERLGDRNVLLDKYLYGVLQALSTTLSIITHEDDGFEFSFEKIRELCKNVRDGRGDDHPLNSILKNYNDTHDIPQATFYYEARCVGLFAAFSQLSYNKCLDNLDTRMQEELKKNGVPEAYKALSSEINETEIDRIFDLILNCFILISPAGKLMQAMLEQLITSLLTLDKENGVFLLQLLLNGNI